MEDCLKNPREILKDGINSVDDFHRLMTSVAFDVVEGRMNIPTARAVIAAMHETRKAKEMENTFGPGAWGSKS